MPPTSLKSLQDAADKLKAETQAKAAAAAAEGKAWPPKAAAGATGQHAAKWTVEESIGPDDDPWALHDAMAFQAKQLARKALEDEEARKKKRLDDERVAKWREEVNAKEKAQRELAEKQAAEKALEDIARQKKLEEEAKRAQEEAEKIQKEQATKREQEVLEMQKKQAQEQREAEAVLKEEEAAKAAEIERKQTEVVAAAAAEKRQKEEEEELEKARELEAKGAQEQRDAEAKERDAIFFSTPIITSVSPRRRSPSLESISSVTSAFSFNDDPGTTSSSPTISVQGAPQGVDTFFIQGEQEDGLHERDSIKTTASPRDDEQLKSVGASQVLTGSDAYPMHERFCFPAENIYFLVQGVLYSVHRYFFERDSSSFVGQGLSKREPMVLANVSMHDFDLFLSILYPTSFIVYPASTVEEWSGILHLADKWSFLSIRALAIAKIAPIASPIDKIVFGRLYGVNEWLVSAYHAVCTRPDALTLEEGRRLGVDDVIRINAIRQEFCFVRVSESSPKLFEEDVESRFGLAIQAEHSAKRKSMKDAADKLMADDAAKAKSKKEQEVKAVEIERQKTEQQAANDAAEAKSKKEQEVNAVEIERQKTEQQAAEKRHKEEAEKEANELERGKRVREQREAEAKWKKEEEALAAETERMKRGLELEYRRAQEQREAEARSKQVAAKVAEIERQQRQQEAADMKAKYRAREQREAEAKAADIERKNAEAAANSKSLKDTLTTTDLLAVSRSLRAYLTPPSRTPTI